MFCFGFKRIHCSGYIKIKSPDRSIAHTPPLEGWITLVPSSVQNSGLNCSNSESQSSVNLPFIWVPLSEQKPKVSFVIHLAPTASVYSGVSWILTKELWSEQFQIRKATGVPILLSEPSARFVVSCASLLVELSVEVFDEHPVTLMQQIVKQTTNAIEIIFLLMFNLIDRFITNR